MIDYRKRTVVEESSQILAESLASRQILKCSCTTDRLVDRGCSDPPVKEIAAASLNATQSSTKASSTIVDISGRILNRDTEMETLTRCNELNSSDRRSLRISPC